MTEKYYTRLEYSIHNFIEKYGADELVKWLAEYSKIVSQTDFNIFNRIQKFVCEVYDIPIADINKKSSTNFDYASAKMTITFLTHRKTKLQPKHLTMLQGCGARTIYNHINVVKFRLENPRAFKSFVENYEKIIKKIDHYESNT